MRLLRRVAEQTTTPLSYLGITPLTTPSLLHRSARAAGSHGHADARATRPPRAATPAHAHEQRPLRRAPLRRGAAGARASHFLLKTRLPPLRAARKLRARCAVHHPLSRLGYCLLCLDGARCALSTCEGGRGDCLLRINCVAWRRLVAFGRAAARLQRRSCGSPPLVHAWLV